MRARITGLLVGMLLLSGCATFTVGERDLLPQPDRPITDRLVGELDPTLSLDTLRLERPDGAVLGGLHVHAPGRDITVVYFGGNQFLADRQSAAVARNLLPLGVNLVLFDHRGSGHSTGEVSLAALREDALAIRDHAVEVLGVPPERLVLHGFSLGGMLAGDVAGRRAAGGLVLESTGSNANEWSRAMVPWYARPFVRVNMADSLHVLDNHRAVGAHDGALLVMVGAEDTQTPPVMSRRLIASAAGDGAFHRLYVAPGLGHEGVLGDPAARDQYAQLIDAIRSALAVPAGTVAGRGP
jgi:pimeloyl-ACP methyl ester carboxylesterase